MGPDPRLWQLDRIRLSDFKVDCVVGLYPSEHKKPQPLLLDLTLYLDTREAGAKGRLSLSVDYAKVAGEVRFILTSCRFKLLETAREALCRYLLAPPTQDAGREQVQAVSLSISKPDALDGMAVPSVEALRFASDYAYEIEDKPFGQVDIIHAITKEFGIYRLRIKPNGCIPTHEHRVMQEHELVLGDGLKLQGRRVAAGSGYSWPQGLAHRYDNPQPIEQTVLCIDRPAFIPGDEVEVDVPLEALQPIEPVLYYPRENSTLKARAG